MKELTIEEKAKAYDEAFDKIADVVEAGTIEQGLAEWLFPELAESEDERIRRWIIDDIRFNMNNEPLNNSEYRKKAEKAIAWLEKQNSNVDNANKEYWRGYREGKQEILDKYAELEKQGEQKPQGKTALEAIHEEKVDNANKVVVEPKFHKGDWIVSDISHEDYRICKILNIENGKYIIESIYGYRGYNNFETFDKDYHLWTIQDAKDGDVLAVTMYPEGTWIGIFKEQNGCTFSSYCFVNTKGIFKRGTHGHGNGEAIHPATEEQRDTLVKAMAEAGYTFDFEKKELKKIESDLTEFENTLADVCRGWIGEELGWKDYIIKNSLPLLELAKKQFDEYEQKPTDEEMKELLRTEYEKGRADAIAEFQKEWSGEDEEMLEDVRDNFEYNKREMTDSLIVQYDKFFDWLKSLRFQNKWKPSEKQMEALKEACDEHWEPDGLDPLYTLYQDLKKLREE